MDGAISLESTPRGINVAKVILGLSFFLPYLVDWVNEVEVQQLAIYAPLWVVLDSDWSSYIGFTPMALFMFFYWLPYVYVGCQSYWFAQGKYSSIGRYIGGIVFITLLAIILILPMSMIPRASIGEMNFFSIVIPLPLVSILAVVLIPLLRPVRITTPWDQDVFAQSDIADSD